MGETMNCSSPPRVTGEQIEAPELRTSRANSPPSLGATTLADHVQPITAVVEVCARGLPAEGGPSALAAFTRYSSAAPRPPPLNGAPTSAVSPESATLPPKKPPMSQAWASLGTSSARSAHSVPCLANRRGDPPPAPPAVGSRGSPTSAVAPERPTLVPNRPPTPPS